MPPNGGIFDIPMMLILHSMVVAMLLVLAAFFMFLTAFFMLLMHFVMALVWLSLNNTAREAGKAKT